MYVGVSFEKACCFPRKIPSGFCVCVYVCGPAEKPFDHHPVLHDDSEETFLRGVFKQPLPLFFEARKGRKEKK
jgi:hypothetical protein